MTDETSNNYRDAYEGFFSDVGRHVDRPFKLLAPITTFSFGDVFLFTSIATRIAASFDHTYCTILVPEGRPFFEDIAGMYPFEKRVLTVPGDWSRLKFVNAMGPASKLDPSGFFYHDLCFTSLFHSSAVLGTLPSVPLRLPEMDLERHAADLVAMGLDPSRWFCTVHWREPSYQYKNTPNLRDANPAKYLQLIDHILSEQGGQVVQLGHPEMHRLDDRPGYVDLSKLPNSWNLQAFAMSRARCFLGGPSGGTGMANAFCIPALYVDATDWYAGLSHDLLLTPEVHLASGEVLRQDNLCERGLLNALELEPRLKSGEIKVINKSTLEEMKHGAERLLHETREVTGWREPPAMDHARPNQLTVPLPARRNARFLEL